MRKMRKKSINVLVKHDITHDMRIKTKVWSMEFPFGHSCFLEEQGEKDLGLGRRRYFWCVFSPFLVYLCSSKKEYKI